MTTGSASPRHRVVVVGGGFGGLYAARALAKAPVEVTLVDRRNHHLFQPLLYQVATGGLSPANIAAPLRQIVRRQRNCQVILASVEDFDLERRRVLLADGALEYDSLIVAAGSSHSYFGRDDWAPLAPGLKSLDQATEIRRRILTAFEVAERETDDARRRAWTTFVIVGGGPTGVELAGALAEIARHTLRLDFRHVDPSHARVLLVEAGPRALHVFPEDLSDWASSSLGRLGVELRAGTKVEEIREGSVTLTCADRREEIATHTVLWAAGVAASPLARKLAERSGAELDRAGRVTVGADLTLPGFPEVQVLGDMARCLDEHGSPLPGLAPVAMQQGRFAGESVVRRLRGEELPAFRYRDHGSMATIGRSAAVAVVGNRHVHGFVAWVLWLVVHLMQLARFENRLLVLLQWSWSYFTFHRSARLITGGESAQFAPRTAHPSPDRSSKA